MTDPTNEELKKQARQDAIYFLVIALTGDMLYQGNPVQNAKRLSDVMDKSLRILFYENDSKVAQSAHAAIMNEVREIIARALHEADRRDFSPELFRFEVEPKPD